MRDHLIELVKPTQKPDWMSQHAYDQAPATLKIRECEAGGKILVTTFIDPKQTPKGTLKALFRQRWQIDIDQPCCLRKAVIRTWKGMSVQRSVGGWPSRAVLCGVRAGVRTPARRPTPASGCARPGGSGGRAPSPYESN